MNIYLKKLEVTNFKSFPPEKIKTFNFEDNNATILDGPNGYGKSTVFDSLELLITGDIVHFESKLKNGYTTFLSIIANKDSYPTEITGHFANEKNKFSIKRIFDWNDGNNSKLIHTDENGDMEDIDDSKVYDLLNINNNFFKIGMYISQNNSLLFLQEKYGDRKKILTSILDMKQIDERIEFIKKIKYAFSERITSIGKKLQEQEKEIKIEEQRLKEIINKTQVGDQLVDYKKIFPAKDFLFDLKDIDITIPIETYKEQIKPIKKLVNNYELLLESNRVKEIAKILNISSLSLKGYFYRDKLHKFSEQKEWWKQLSNLNNFFRKNIISYEIVTYELIKDKEISQKIKQYHVLLSEKSILEKTITGDKSEIITLNKKRKELKEQQKHQHIIDDEHCPFCGIFNKDLEKSYNDLTIILESTLGHNEKNLNQHIVSIAELERSILTILKEILEPYEKELSLFSEIQNLKSITKEELSSIEKVFSNFSSIFKETEAKIEKEERSFSYLLELFYSKLRELKGNEQIFSDDELNELNEIHKKVFDNNKPSISIEDLNVKYLYIQSKYRDTYEYKLQKNKEKSEQLEEIFKKHKRAKEVNNLLELIRDYNNEAYKIYQEQFIKKIQLPLFLISGRIIQNYQLGLGIYAEVNKTQVVFKVNHDNKKMNTDIFNILSIGQLNGVIISILLAIRKIYSKENQLNMIMIDDPLQSIDDVSAHSFADILVEEFPNTQVLLSTHEEDKSRLIQYKYQQVKKNTNNYNMQMEYLKP
ncbi:AAA family ATPase [Vagococcus salmoninarum]|uniref:AAA family ATPase n=1 Tax=Vagococcus salmoninarum TaxID=2739 RepID=UPI0018818819|nr:AAA family ATPase [Vagococcus salmoninarum]MBE9387803.1 AAA family ATPase [Vagococcus salmoninarum]